MSLGENRSRVVRQRRAFFTDVLTAANALTDVSLEALEATTTGGAPWLSRVAEMKFGRHALRRAQRHGVEHRSDPKDVAHDLVKRFLEPISTPAADAQLALATTVKGRRRASNAAGESSSFSFFANSSNYLLRSCVPWYSSTLLYMVG